MKAKTYIIIAVVTVMFTSCAPTTFFQAYKAVPSDEMTADDYALKYEDDNCTVFYDFWGDGGNIGFKFHNKTDENIYLKLDESYFILNGMSFNYYKNRVITYSKGAGISAASGASASKAVTGWNNNYLLQTNQMSATSTVGSMVSKGYAVAYTEDKVICIPPKTSKVISEYAINRTLIRNCDLYKYPSKKQINTVTYTKDTSPLVFSNRIAYIVGESDNLIKFENEFYVTEITNYPEVEFIYSEYEEYCGQKSTTKSKFYEGVSADKFFMEYKKGTDTWKH